MTRTKAKKEAQRLSRTQQRKQIKELAATRRWGYTIYGQPTREYMQSDAWREFKERFFASNLQQNCFICFVPHQPDMQVVHHNFIRCGAENLNDVVAVCFNCYTRAREEYVKRGSKAEGLWYVVRALRDEYRVEHPEPRGERVTISRCWKCDRNVMSYHDFVQDKFRKGLQFSHVDCSKVTYKSKQKKSR